MKKFNLYLILIVLMFIPTLQSCLDDDDNGYSLDNASITIATVKKEAGNTLYFVLDNGKTLWPAAALVPYQGLENGARIVGSFTYLSDKQNGFDHYVRLNDYSTILTKNVINLTAANKDSIGDDPVRITDMWVSGDYLNVEFNMNIPSVQKHRVNLVKNTTKEYPNDGYIHLEYRYNDMNDVTGCVAHSIVSFKLGDLGVDKTDKNGLKIRINSAVNGEKIITIDYNAFRYTKSTEMMQNSVQGKVN